MILTVHVPGLNCPLIKEAIVLSPKGTVIDSTLDSDAIIQQQRIKDSFSAVKGTGQIENADKEDDAMCLFLIILAYN